MAPASILRIHLHKRAQGSLLWVLAILMSWSFLVEHMIDTAYRSKIEVASFIRLK